jgi:hypothetical protein
MKFFLAQLLVVETSVISIHNIKHFGNGFICMCSVTTAALHLKNLLCPEAVSINKADTLFYSQIKRVDTRVM